MIKCTDVKAGYGAAEILHGVSWELEAGKMTVIIGPNGSGKSTLLKAVMGHARVTGGRICLEGRPVADWNPKELAKKIAYMPQSRNDANISVGRMVLHGRFPYLAYPRQYQKEDEQRVTDALRRMGIEHFRNKLVSELSGGEKQKTYLAMALTQDTPILFLDEPSVYLDLSWQLELMDMLKALREEGRTVVTVLHDLNHALQYADRLLVMEQGCVRAYGTPEEIMESGVIGDVFGLKAGSVRDADNGVQYFFSRIRETSGVQKAVQK